MSGTRSNHPRAAQVLLQAAAAILLLFGASCFGGGLRTVGVFGERIDIPEGLTSKNVIDLDLKELYLFNVKPARMASLISESENARSAGHPVGVFSSKHPPEKLFAYFEWRGESALGPEGLRDPESDITYNAYTFPSKEGREGRVLIASLNQKTLIVYRIQYYEAPKVKEPSERQDIQRRRRSSPGKLGN